MDNLNDPYCQEFVEVIAAILVHLAQERQPPEEQPVLALVPVHGFPLREREAAWRWRANER